MKPFFSGPLSQKVLVGFCTSAALFLLTWIATTWVWKAGVPVSFKPVLDGLASTIGFLAGSYAARHQATLAELERAIAAAEAVNALRQGQQQFMLVSHTHPVQTLTTGGKP